MALAGTGEAPTTEPVPGLCGGPGGDATSADQAPDPLHALLGHLGDAVAAGRTQLAVLRDEAALAIDRLLIRLFLAVFIVALAFVVACVGGSHLIVGALLGLELLIGSRFAAELLIGVACLGFAGALIAGLLGHHRRTRLATLRRRYGADAVAP